jgi:hypothetical protein
MERTNAFVTKKLLRTRSCAGRGCHQPRCPGDAADRPGDRLVVTSAVQGSVRPESTPAVGSVVGHRRACTRLVGVIPAKKRWFAGRFKVIEELMGLETRQHCFTGDAEY